MSITFPCPKCGGMQTRVSDSRAGNVPAPHVRRTRRCLACAHRFSTREIAAGMGMDILDAQERVDEHRHLLRRIHRLADTPDSLAEIKRATAQVLGIPEHR